VRTQALAAIAALLPACSGGDDPPAGTPDAQVVTADAQIIAAPDAQVDAAPAAPDAGPAVLTSTATFATGLGSLCGLGYRHTAGEIWVFPCSGAMVHAFSPAGVAGATLARPGESADDADVTFAPAALTIGAAAVAEGAMIFVNGETGPADLHLPETTGAAPVAVMFGTNHVVGGAVHAARSSIFVVQDRQSSTDTSTIAELDPATGAVRDKFPTQPAFSVNYGDVEVCPSSGNLFVVSSDETTIVELTPTGATVAAHPLPAGVSALSGLGLAADGVAWVSGTNGSVWRIEGLPCDR
jgi:hypothetical protein